LERGGATCRPRGPFLFFRETQYDDAANRMMKPIEADQRRGIEPLQTIEVETGPSPTGTVIWMHGLGADGHDFEPIVPELVHPRERALRFVFPNAPIRPVTVNGGYAMRAWYDIAGIDRHAKQDEAGIRAADAAICALIRRENGRGIPARRVVLAGFSQGGAISLFTGTRYSEQLAGIVGLSCYMLLAATFDAERAAANQSTPIFMGHGESDPVVNPTLGKETRDLLAAAHYPVEWHDYPMPHTVCQEEIAHIRAWLRAVL
jgi:phospholipase/carboxylesterase